MQFLHLTQEGFAITVSGLLHGHKKALGYEYADGRPRSSVCVLGTLVSTAEAFASTILKGPSNGMIRYFGFDTQHEEIAVAATKETGDTFIVLAPELAFVAENVRSHFIATLRTLCVNAPNTVIVVPQTIQGEVLRRDIMWAAARDAASWCQVQVKGAACMAESDSYEILAFADVQAGDGSGASYGVAVARNIRMALQDDMVNLDGELLFKIVQKINDVSGKAPLVPYAVWELIYEYMQGRHNQLLA